MEGDIKKSGIRKNVKGCKMRSEALTEQNRGVGDGKLTSISPESPKFSSPGMQLLMAHLPKENLLFLVAQKLKGSIYFKN